jgi:hypothetical protein
MEFTMKRSNEISGLFLSILLVLIPYTMLQAAEGKIVQSYKHYPGRHLPGFGDGSDLSALAKKFFSMDLSSLESRVSESSTATVLIKGNMVRINPEDAKAANSVIFKADRKTVVILDHEGKTSLELSLDQLGKMSSEISYFPEDPMYDSNEATRETAPAEKPSIEKLGTSREINGFKCEGSRFDTDEDLSEVWITGENSDLFEDFKDWIESLSDAKGVKDLDENLMKKIEYFDGFPVLSKTITSSGLSVMEIKSIETVPVSAELFEAPEEYRKMSYQEMIIEMMKGMQKFLEEMGTNGEGE